MADAEDPVRRGLALVDVRDASAPPGSGGLVADARWATANLLIKHGWPRRIRGYAAAAPRLGTVTARVRFAGVVLNVGRGVFAPRGLAESLVEEAVRALSSREGGAVVDVGTGCGPVALAIASVLPDVEIHATEISRPALLWAAWNRRRLGASNVSFHRGSVLDPLPNRLHRRVRVLTANLPYVPLEEWQDGWRGREFQVVGPETDGLGYYRRLARHARAFLTDDARMIMQMQARQWDGFADELCDLGYRPGEILRRWGNDVAVWADVSPIG
jgi:methylase of polypeptide subunit release factors